MSARLPVVHVQFNGQDVALHFKHPMPVTPGAQPERAGLPLRCVSCNLWCHAEGAVVLTYVDDDHYACTDFGYEARPASACKSCGSPLQVALRFTLTRHRGDVEHPQFEWDAVEGSADW
jgi:hypothetical protein